MPVRRRAQRLLALSLFTALLAIGAFATLLLDKVADAGAQALLHPSAQAAELLSGQWHGAVIALWLSIIALGALALGLGLAGAQLWLIGPLESAARDLAQDPLLPPTEQTDEISRLSAAVAYYRRQFDRDTHEMTAQRHASQSLREAADGATAQLQQTDSLALVGQVAMGVAHEVGGPLAIALGYLERLNVLQKEGASPQEQQRCIDQADAALQRISTILSDLAQPGLPRTRDADRPTDLLAVALRVVSLAEQHPRAKRLQIEVHGSQAQHPADASSSHVEQVALNLVVNAADAMHGSGQVDLRVSRDGDWQLLEVDDSGPGIAAGDREKIFEPFFSTKGRQGWGLGLAVSRRIISSYGGVLDVDVSPKGGARFRIKLPVPAANRHSAARKL